MRHVADEQQARPVPHRATVGLHRKQRYLMPVGNQTHPVGQLLRSRRDVIPQRRQASRPQLAVRILPDSEADLPLVAAIELDDQVPGSKAAHQPVRIRGPARQAELQHVHWRRGVHGRLAQARELAQLRKAPVGTHREQRPQCVPPARGPIHGLKSRPMAPPPLLKLLSPVVGPDVVELVELKIPAKRKLAWRMTVVSEVS